LNGFGIDHTRANVIDLFCTLVQEGRISTDTHCELRRIVGIGLNKQML